MPQPGIILASASPRRVELLRFFPFRFEIMPSQAEELHDESLRAAQLCATNALRKAELVARQYPNAVVFGADTLVTLNGAHFGKPRDTDEAIRMLSELSGRTHQVTTSVSLLQLAEDRREVLTDETQVTFNTLSMEMIRAYLAKVPVLDKAGAYGIQNHGELLVQRIEGSLSNMIGLPIEKLAETCCRWKLITPRERDKIVGSQHPRSPGS